MLYMSGGGIQIWNLGIVFMLMLGPLQALAKINQGALGVLLAVPAREGIFADTTSSFRTFCSFNGGGYEGDVNAVAAEAGLSRMQPAHDRRRVVEVQVHGLVTRGDGRLVAVRD